MSDITFVLYVVGFFILLLISVVSLYRAIRERDQIIKREKEEAEKRRKKETPIYKL